MTLNFLRRAQNVRRRAQNFVRRALNFLRRALHFLRRALHFLRRALLFLRRALNFLRRALKSCEPCCEPCCAQEDALEKGAVPAAPAYGTQDTRPILVMGHTNVYSSKIKICCQLFEVMFFFRIFRSFLLVLDTFTGVL